MKYLPEFLDALKEFTFKNKYPALLSLQMIISIVHNISLAENQILSAYRLSNRLNKLFGVVGVCDNQQSKVQFQTELDLLLDKLGVATPNIYLFNQYPFDFSDICESKEVSFLFIQLTTKRKNLIRSYLEACRNLRIPYLLYKPDFPVLQLHQILLPVGFLIEEIEKAQFASAFGRFCHTKITLLQARDYGSKAETNVRKIQNVLSKGGVNWQLVIGKTDSFKIEYEALKIAHQQQYDLVIISASREYGLDDIIFGPKELHAIKKSTVPIMLINPRADLYVLCD